MSDKFDQIANVLKHTTANGNGDPVAKIKGMPLNLGEPALPHILTFQGLVSTISKVYRASDEALKHSYENARFMRNDPMIRECTDQRQRSTALLNWHLEADDEKDPTQKKLCEDLTQCIESIPRFMQYRENLLHAVWFGRYAVQHKWGWKRIGGEMRLIPTWTPLHGDKLVFRYDDGRGEYDPDQVGVRVGPYYDTGAKKIANRWKIEDVASSIEPTDRGRAYFLAPHERNLLAIHKHYIEDGEYDDPVNAGRIHGTGVRSVLYWTWYQKQESLAWLMEYLERSAFGVEFWYYPWGNDQAKEKVQTAANERIGQGRNIVLVPKPLGEDGYNYGVERIEPGMGGAEVVMRIISEYFGHQIKRLILGQTLTSEAAATGLGSGVASLHLDTYMQIIQYDAINLEETLTTDLVTVLKNLNFPTLANVPVHFKIDTQAADVESKLSAWKQAFDMGLKIKAQDLMDLVGASKPLPDDEVLQAPQQAAAGQPPEGQAQYDAQGRTIKGPSVAAALSGDAAAVYAELQKARDVKQLTHELGIGDAGERTRLDAPAVDGQGEPAETPAPHPSGFAADELAAEFGRVLPVVSDPAMALKVAVKNLEQGRADAEQYAKFNESEHPRDEEGKFSSGAESATSDTNSREREVSNLVKSVVGPQEISQPRAKAGGEYGPNGEWYKGGAFIATTDMPKRIRKKIEDSVKGKVQVDGYRWEVPQPGLMSILDRLGGTVLNPRNGEINYQYLEYIKADEPYIKAAENAVKKWREGERWISVVDFPELAGIKDAARLVVTGQAVPGALLDKLPSEWRGYLEKYTPPNRKSSHHQEQYAKQFDESEHPRSTDGEFATKPGESASTQSTPKPSGWDVTRAELSRRSDVLASSDGKEFAADVFGAVHDYLEQGDVQEAIEHVDSVLDDSSEEGRKVLETLKRDLQADLLTEEERAEVSDLEEQYSGHQDDLLRELHKRFGSDELRVRQALSQVGLSGAQWSGHTPEQAADKWLKENASDLNDLVNDWRESIDGMLPAALRGRKKAVLKRMVQSLLADLEDVDEKEQYAKLNEDEPANLASLFAAEFQARGM